MQRTTAGLVAAFLLLPVSLVSAQRQPPPLVFRIGFWNNLHHFLYVLGRAQNHTADAQRDAVKNAPSELKALSGRPDADRTAWQAAVGFYAAGPSKLDAVFDTDTLVRTTQALASAADSADLTALNLDPDLVAALVRAAPVYRAVWWDAHRHADEARQGDLQRLVERYGTALVNRMTSIYHTTWPDQPRVVNLAAYTNWAGADDPSWSSRLAGWALYFPRPIALPGLQPTAARITYGPALLMALPRTSSTASQTSSLPLATRTRPFSRFYPETISSPMQA